MYCFVRKQAIVSTPYVILGVYASNKYSGVSRDNLVSYFRVGLGVHRYSEYSEYSVLRILPRSMNIFLRILRVDQEEELSIADSLLLKSQVSVTS
jgi:hypothetical protein